MSHYTCAAPVRRRRTYSSPSLLRAALLLLVFNAIAVEGSFRLCGFRLTMTLTAICKNQICGGYVAPPAKRRVSADADLDSYDSEFTTDGTEDGDSSSFELANDNYGDLLEEGGVPTRKRSHEVDKRAGGIATECCEKRCTLSYLKTFCCAALQLPSAGGAGASATTGSGASSKASMAAALLANKKKTTTRLPAMAFIGGTSGEGDSIADLLVVR